MNKKVWLIGASPIAQEHAKVLISLGVNLTVIEKDQTRASEFELKLNHKVFVGYLSDYINLNPEIPEYAINAVGIDYLASVTQELLNYEIKNILVEKPGAFNVIQLEETSKIADIKEAKVFIAYNRRFYTSTIEARKIILDDGGVTSFHFEFTEMSHKIETQDKPANIKSVWFLGNSTHVVDLAFFLGGKPKEISA